MNFLKKIIISLTAAPVMVLAGSFTVDKVYDPYVEPLEKEVEWRMVSGDGEQRHLFGIGQSLSDRLFVEGYVIGKDEEGHFALDALEIEAKWQLTEQGEHSADWGLLFELERVQHDDTWELSTAVLIAKQWGRWVGTANVGVGYEWGNKIKNEFESTLALQAKYRYSRGLEPAIEFYSSEKGQAIGPVVMGDLRLENAKKLHWEVGSIFGLGYKGPDNTWRLLLEYDY